MAPHKRPRPLPPPPDHPIAASDEASLTGLDALAMLQQKQDPGIEKAGDDAQTISEKELALEAEERREGLELDESSFFLPCLFRSHRRCCFPADFYGRIGEVRSSDEEYDEANSPEYAIHFHHVSLSFAFVASLFPSAVIWFFDGILVALPDRWLGAIEDLKFLFVKVADVREIVRCPICLGIIRKTRTVMECLHRFCRECIDKSMRLGNNECPACRTHCASRRSLRDDPKYDALIAALYPDIDKYEEEELSFFEEERSRSQKIQLYIAETFQRQSEALGRKRSTTRASTSFGRKSQGSYLRGRGRKNIASDDTANADSDEEADANGNYGTKGSSATDEPSPDWRPKRPKEWGTPQSSPARTLGSVNVSSEENEDFEINREPVSASPLQSRSREILAWGKNGTRSQTRHNSSSSSNGRLVRGAMGKLADFLRNLEEVDEEFDVNVIMVPLDESMPNLEQPYLSCRQTLLITHLRQFIALQASAQPEEVEIFVRKPQEESLAVRSGSLVDNASTDFSTGLKILEGGESLGTLYASYTGDKGELVRFLHWCFGILSENSEVEKTQHCITCSFDLDDAKQVYTPNILEDIKPPLIVYLKSREIKKLV
ncbi:hypothetical protein ZIOFF_057163 [Zingiber officinale]|uniref:RING-type domain-containing protein n=1 Tax=Zingiber officinale TaxID=94328 RepID=A0A8J5FC36_ZINOF|nr:hypothetical protein ZIOFF_057163 [Zingiber officinale]